GGEFYGLGCGNGRSTGRLRACVSDNVSRRSTDGNRRRTVAGQGRGHSHKRDYEEGELAGLSADAHIDAASYNERGCRVAGGTAAGKGFEAEENTEARFRSERRADRSIRAVLQILSPFCANLFALRWCRAYGLVGPGHGKVREIDSEGRRDCP